MRKLHSSSNLLQWWPWQLQFPDGKVPFEWAHRKSLVESLRL
jgi:hypothetical protein